MADSCRLWGFTEASNHYFQPGFQNCLPIISHSSLTSGHCNTGVLGTSSLLVAYCFGVSAQELRAYWLVFEISLLQTPLHGLPKVEVDFSGYNFPNPRQSRRRSRCSLERNCSTFSTTQTLRCRSITWLNVAILGSNVANNAHLGSFVSK